MSYVLATGAASGFGVTNDTKMFFKNSLWYRIERCTTIYGMSFWISQPPFALHSSAHPFYLCFLLML